LALVEQVAWAVLGLLTVVLGTALYVRTGSVVATVVAVLLILKVAALIYMVAGLDIRVSTVYLINKKTGQAWGFDITAGRIIVVSNALSLAAIVYNRERIEGWLSRAAAPRS